MIYPGLVSITFRNFSVEKVVELSSSANLTGIEWGGDVHVPCGNIAQARYVSGITRNAGLKVVSYGSYFFVGHDDTEIFKRVLETALELNAPTIRIWAGKKDAKDSDNEYFKLIVKQTQSIADIAMETGIKLAYEFHGQTLTSTSVNAEKLLRAVDRKNVGVYWQPCPDGTSQYRDKDIMIVLPWLINVHAFHWAGNIEKRLLLIEAKEKWERYLHIISSTKREHFIMLEYVKNDDPENFIKDVKTLNEIIATVTNGEYSE